MATTAISEEEFQRLQEQLIDLRTKNYELDSAGKKLQIANKTLNNKCEELEKELQKANKTINKSKKSKEVEQLYEEYEVVQKKLRAQEDQFQHQNEALLTELAKLVADNERLEKLVSDKRVSHSGGAIERDVSDQSDVHDEVRRLQAENVALKRHGPLAEGSEVEALNSKVRLLMDVNSELELKCMRLLGERAAPCGSSNLQESECDVTSMPDERLVEGQASDENEAGGTHKGSMTYSVKEGTALMELLSITEEKCTSFEKELKLSREKQLKMEVLEEEQNMLRDELSKTEALLRDTSKRLGEELDVVNEKLRKKQEILLQVQAEKDEQYMNSKKALESLEEERNVERKKLSEEIQQQKTQLLESSQMQKEYEKENASMKSSIGQLENELRHLREQQKTVNPQEYSNLRDEVERLERERDEGKTCLNERHAEITAMSNEIKLLRDDNDSLKKRLDESNNTAEKRKLILDEMAIKLQKMSDAHREEVGTLTANYKEKVEAMSEEQSVEREKLKAQLDEEKVQRLEFEQSKETIISLEAEIKGVNEAKNWLQRRLEEVESLAAQSKAEHEETIDSLSILHKDEIQKLNQSHHMEVEVLQSELEEAQVAVTGHENTISKLRQDTKDGIEERKIHEKKGANIVKELKRQVQMERKRAEKLQEKLQEILTEYSKLSNGKQQSVDELLKSDKGGNTWTEVSSVSSWSVVSGDGHHRRQSSAGSSIAAGCVVPPSVSSSDLQQQYQVVAASHSSSPTSPSEELVGVHVLERDNMELMARLTHIQQERCNLEERVAHLETSCSAMADDLVNKSAIIQHYIMDGRSDVQKSPSLSGLSLDKVPSLKKVLDFMKDRSEIDMGEMNKKLQRMLEETLTKNMHLQKDLEVMSEENMRLKALD